MIDVQNITKRYGNLTAIDRVTFSVAKGEVLAFLGPNGAGKTTTMRILTCFMPATEGTAKVAGFDCADQPLEVKRRIGYLPETPPVYQEFTVSEYLTFVGRMRGMVGKNLTTALDQSIEKLALGTVRHRLIGNLSRGYRQRVGLAQAVLHDPPVLILDEPTVGLDPKQIIEIRDLIKSLAGSHSVILSTHILPEATAVCQRVVIISGGRIVAEDTPDQLSARLRHSEKIAVTIKAPPDNCLARLQSISGILNVFQGQSAGTFLLECALGQDKRDEVARFVIANQWGLLELRTISMTLEDVFLQLTRHEEGMTPQTDQVSELPPGHTGDRLMTPVQAIIAKELRGYFVSPVVYVVGAIFLLIFGFLSYLYVVYAGYQAIQIMQMQGGQAQLNLNDLVFRNLFASMRFVLLIILPILTMRLFAEERKLRTFEFLMTSPIGINEIVAGKFVSVFLVFLSLLGLTGLVPTVLMLFSDFDWNPIWTGYLGMTLLGALFISVGLLASAITENQIVAAFLSFGMLLLIWLISGLGALLGDTTLGQIISYVSFMDHYDRLVRGLIDTKDLVYFFSSLAFMLFLTHRVVESTRWK